MFRAGPSASESKAAFCGLGLAVVSCVTPLTLQPWFGALTTPHGESLFGGFLRALRQAGGRRKLRAALGAAKRQTRRAGRSPWIRGREMDARGRLEAPLMDLPPGSQ